jgi:hypothetical protein
MFTCGFSSVCIDPKNVCDGEFYFFFFFKLFVRKFCFIFDSGVNNCAFGLDEQNCESFNCLTGYYKCNKTNKCIQNNSVCDGKNDCFYGEDEMNCGKNLWTKF